jgi:hypothetical protein
MKIDLEEDITGYINNVFEEGGFFSKKYYAVLNVNLKENNETLGIYFPRKEISRKEYDSLKEQIDKGIHPSIEGKLDLSLKIKK